MAAIEITRRTAQTAASPAEGLHRLRRLIPRIQALAVGSDQDGAFPRAELDLLRDAGALNTFATSGVPALDLMEALRLVGRASLSVGRVFEGHVNGARLVRDHGDAAQARALSSALEAGRLLGVWNTEPPPGVRIVEAEGRATLSGAKSYATGAGHIDQAVVTAALPGGERQMLSIDASDPARADPSAWNVRGMRATVSGLYDLTGLPADAADRLGGPGDYEREPAFTAGAWRFTAVQLGGVERVLGLLRDHLAQGPGGADPIHRARFGAALADARSAYLWVREAAARVEAPEAGPDEVAFVLMTRGVVERAGLAAMEAAARSVGTRAFFADLPLDLACRDLALYLRQPVPDQALDRAAAAFIERDRWRGDALW